MLIPKEQPYLTGLNSYYLYIDKFVEHLQGEIGSGCLYCQAPDQELLVYFDEREIVRGITQNNGERAQVSPSLDPVLKALAVKNFLVTIYYLDSSSIFFWGQMPPFQRAKAKLKSSDIAMPDLIFRLRQKKFSGFIDVNVQDRDDGAILFFHRGDRKGGSYSWGKGGLNSSDENYNRLLGLLQTNVASFDIGHFKVDSTKQAAPEEAENGAGKGHYFSNLNTAADEFLDLFTKAVRKKVKTEPLVQLRQKFLDLMDEHTILDPFNNYYELHDNGTVEFADNAPREEIVAAIVDCAWKVVEDVKQQKKFRAAINKWAYRSALEERGIDVER